MRSPCCWHHWCAEGATLLCRCRRRGQLMLRHHCDWLTMPHCRSFADQGAVSAAVLDGDPTVFHCLETVGLLRRSAAVPLAFQAGSCGHLAAQRTLLPQQTQCAAGLHGFADPCFHVQIGNLCSQGQYPGGINAYSSSSNMLWWPPHLCHAGFCCGGPERWQRT